MFPIRDSIPSTRPPVINTAIIVVNVLVFLFQATLSDGQLAQMVHLYGIVPLRYVQPSWAREVGFPPLEFWPFLTSMFLHGGIVHLVVNMWSLWIFGDNVEDKMGSIRYLAFYLLCGVASGLMHLVTNPFSPMPAIGASGAIAGVLGAYFLLFPKSWILCVIPIFIFPLFVQVPAFVYLLLWFCLQFFSGTLSLLNPEESGGIAWWAHIGGFACGLYFYRYFLRGAERRLLTQLSGGRLRRR